MSLPDTPDNRPGAGRWPKGHSGNPGGRKPKTAEARAVETLARKASLEAFEVVHSIMKGGDSDRVRLAAAVAVIERAHGKPGDVVAVPIVVPEGATLSQCAQAIIDSAMRGEASTAQASALLSCLASVAKVREVDELEARISALEAKGAP